MRRHRGCGQGTAANSRGRGPGGSVEVVRLTLQVSQQTRAYQESTPVDRTGSLQPLE